MRVARTQTDGASGGLLHTTPAQWHRYQRLVVYLVRRVPLRTSPRCCPFTHHEGTAANRQPPRSTLLAQTGWAFAGHFGSGGCSEEMGLREGGRRRNGVLGRRDRP